MQISKGAEVKRYAIDILIVKIFLTSFVSLSKIKRKTGWCTQLVVNNVLMA